MYKLILFAITTIVENQPGQCDCFSHDLSQGAKRRDCMILLIILFFALQVLILFCCLAAGNDPYSQQLSDQEQLEFLARWKKEHGRE